MYILGETTVMVTKYNFLNLWKWLVSQMSIAIFCPIEKNITIE